MVAAAISDAFLITLFAVSFPMVVGLMAWIVRELSRVNDAVSRMEERSAAHAERTVEVLHGLDDRVKLLESRSP